MKIFKNLRTVSSHPKETLDPLAVLPQSTPRPLVPPQATTTSDLMDLPLLDIRMDGVGQCVILCDWLLCLVCPQGASMVEYMPVHHSFLQLNNILLQPQHFIS